MGLMSLNNEIKKIDVVLHDSKLEYYESMLKNFGDWISFKREIKLTNLLEGKKIQFDIEEIYNKGVIWGIMNPSSDVVLLKEACFDVKSMHFIIKDDDVQKLTLGIKPLSTDNGEILKSLIESNVEIEIHQYIQNGELRYFYIKLPKSAA